MTLASPLPLRLQRHSVASWLRELHVRGELADDERGVVAIVGARAATATGMQRAHALARHAAERGTVIVSGGALGIDGAAHRGALAAPGGRTIVVLGSGLDHYYPPRHAPLFAAIVDDGRGAIVSMFPPAMPPRRATFLTRNKLIAALADLAIVVEASTRSGSLSTAAAARALGVPLAAWPGTPGCDRLIEGGAAVVESTDDLDLALAGRPRRPAPRALGPIEARVMEAYATGAVSVDDVVRITGLTVRDVVRTLPLVRKS